MNRPHFDAMQRELSGRLILDRARRLAGELDGLREDALIVTADTEAFQRDERLCAEHVVDLLQSATGYAWALGGVLTGTDVRQQLNAADGPPTEKST